MAVWLFQNLLYLDLPVIAVLCCLTVAAGLFYAGVLTGGCYFYVLIMTTEPSLHNLSHVTPVIPYKLPFGKLDTSFHIHLCFSHLISHRPALSLSVCLYVQFQRKISGPSSGCCWTLLFYRGVWERSNVSVPSTSWCYAHTNQCVNTVLWH